MRKGGEVKIKKFRRAAVRKAPDTVRSTETMPDFLARLRAIYGDKVLAVSGADLIA